MKITLKDGSVKEYEHSMSVIDIAKDLSEGLARVATSGRVNGELVDLRTVVDSDSEVDILTFENEEGKALTPVKETVMCAALTDYNCAKNPMCVAPKETVECSSEIKMAPQSFIIVEIK